MRAVLFAYHDVGCAGLRTLHEIGVDVALVYTHGDDPAEDTWFGSVRRTCAELDVPVAVGADPNAPDQVERIAALEPDALFSMYYRDILRDPVLATGRHGAVNLHGSLLPRYRGRAPVNWMILHGEREGGVTLHDMVAKPDAGDVIDREAFPIGPDDRPTDVYRNVVAAGTRVLRRSATAVLDGSARRVRQLESNATTFGRRRPEDGRIDFRHRAEDVRNLIRAVTHPYPGAFAYAGFRRVAIWWSVHAGPVPDGRPGEIRHRDDDVLVVCADGNALRIVEADVEGTLPGDDLLTTLPRGLTLTSHPTGAPSWTS